jgi:hypothetical protein
MFVMSVRVTVIVIRATIITIVSSRSLMLENNLCACGGLFRTNPFAINNSFV